VAVSQTQVANAQKGLTDAQTSLSNVQAQADSSLNLLYAKIDNSLADAYNKGDGSLTIACQNPGTEEITDSTQHPQHSANLHSDGWVSKDQDPNRTSKAILIGGAPDDPKSDYERDKLNCDINTMKDKLVNGYGLKYDKDDSKNSDIQILKCPDKEEIANAMKKVQKDGGKNSQILIYYYGHGGVNYLCTHSDTENFDPANMDKTTLQNYTNKYLGDYGNTSLIIDACHSGSFVK